MGKNQFVVYAGYYHVVDGVPHTIDTQQSQKGIEGVVGLADSCGRIWEIRNRVLSPSDLGFSALRISGELLRRGNFSPDFLNGTIYYSNSLKQAKVSPLDSGVFLGLANEIRREVRSCSCQLI